MNTKPPVSKVMTYRVRIEILTADVKDTVHKIQNLHFTFKPLTMQSLERIPPTKILYSAIYIKNLELTKRKGKEQKIT